MGLFRAFFKDFDQDPLKAPTQQPPFCVGGQVSAPPSHAARLHISWLPELEKHPGSLEASQSSRESTRYPRDMKKPDPGGDPLGGVWSLEDTEWILEKIARLRGSSDAFRAQDSDPGVFKCVEYVLGASKNRKSENAQNAILNIRFCDVKKWSKRPWDPHNGIRLEKLCPRVVSNRKMAGRMTSKL